MASRFDFYQSCVHRHHLDKGWGFSAHRDDLVATRNELGQFDLRRVNLLVEHLQLLSQRDAPFHISTSLILRQGNYQLHFIDQFCIGVGCRLALHRDGTFLSILLI